MDLTEAILMLLNRHHGLPVWSHVICVQASCLSEEVRKEADIRRLSVSSFLSAKDAAELADKRAHELVLSKLKELEKEGLISSKDYGEKIIRRMEKMNVKMSPHLMEQLKVSFIRYKLTKLGSQRIWEYVSGRLGKK